MESRSTPEQADAQDVIRGRRPAAVDRSVVDPALAVPLLSKHQLASKTISKPPGFQIWNLFAGQGFMPSISWILTYRTRLGLPRLLLLESQKRRCFVPQCIPYVRQLMTGLQ